jgi:hypothetical protein
MGPGGTPSHLEALAMEDVVPILEKVTVVVLISQLA